MQKAQTSGRRCGYVEAHMLNLNHLLTPRSMLNFPMLNVQESVITLDEHSSRVPMIQNTICRYRTSQAFMLNMANSNNINRCTGIYWADCEAQRQSGNCLISLLDKSM